MSYCVNCGVELNPGARECPLCRTPVVNPSCPVDAAEPGFFPVRREEVAPVSRREAAYVCTPNPEIVMAARENAALRAEIAAMGWTVVDTAQGPQVSKN